MQRLKPIPLLVISLTIMSQTAMSETLPWNLTMEKDGISVYTRRGPADSSVDEFKGNIRIETNLSALCSVMNSFSDYPNWFYKCKLGKNIKKLNDKEGYAYIIYRIPWPYNDRDLIVRYKLTQGEDRTVFIEFNGNPREIEDHPEFISVKKDLVRVDKASGHWKFTPKESQLIEVEYRLHMEPGGNVPAWLANKYLSGIPFHTLQKLREEVKKNQHTSAWIEWLR